MPLVGFKPALFPTNRTYVDYIYKEVILAEIRVKKLKLNTISCVHRDVSIFKTQT